MKAKQAFLLSFRKGVGEDIEPYLSPPLEKDRVRPWTGRECERADCLCRFILVWVDQFIETFVSKRLEEPFAVGC
jgi:hypothetical protein